jgi:hypothetical protein
MCLAHVAHDDGWRIIMDVAPSPLARAQRGRYPPVGDGVGRGRGARGPTRGVGDDATKHDPIDARSLRAHDPRR